MGENLAAGSLSGARAVEEWYNEVDIYKASPGGFSFNTGHFTQVLATMFLVYRVLRLNYAPETESLLLTYRVTHHVVSTLPLTLM